MRKKQEKVGSSIIVGSIEIAHLILLKFTLPGTWKHRWSLSDDLLPLKRKVQAPVLTIFTTASLISFMPYFPGYNPRKIN